MLIVTMTRGSSRVQGGSGRLVVVDEDDDALPVVAMTTENITTGRLVFGPVPSVQDGKLAIVHGGASIGLTLASVPAAACPAATILESTAVYEVSFGSSLP